MQKVYFEVLQYKQFPRRYATEAEDDVTLDDVAKRIYELELGAWEFIFIAPKAANFGKGSFQEINLF